MSKHFCPHCGGLRFSTVAHVAQYWLVDEDGNFIEEIETTETVADPDDGNTWTCAKCGNDGEIVEGNICARKLAQCATAMMHWVYANYKNYSLDSANVLNIAISVFDADTVKDVIACSLLTEKDDGRISLANSKWAQDVVLPKYMQQSDVIEASLAVKGVHQGLCNLLASAYRRYEAGKA